MRYTRSRVLPLVFALAATSLITACTASGQQSPARVTPWTTSRVKGSPDPPLPYMATRIFTNVALDKPTEARWLPSAQKWVATASGPKLVTFENDPENATATELLNFNDVVPRNTEAKNVHGVIFHPDIENQPWCFVTYVSKYKDPKGVHLARLKVTDPVKPAFDLDSLEILLTWSSLGHIGMAMQFGPDGMLYVTAGDGQRPTPPDPNNVGQDISNIQSTIMRIDVNDPQPGRPYRIPADNPFVGQPNARGEIWAFGVRQPWKIAFDPKTGDLFCADVGWEMREMVHRIVRGRNHGWSIMEGSQPLKPGIKPPIPITPPLFEHERLEARSISGGHFWQSDRIPELKGAYIYGDFMTGKVWALKHKGDQVVWQKELVDTPLPVIGFMLDPAGEVLILSYDGSIMRLDPNTDATDPRLFPRRLTETGIFSDVPGQKPSPGVVEYEISAHRWADGTHSRQWIAIPDTEQLEVHKKDNFQIQAHKGRFKFPAGTVMAKTVSYRTDPNKATSERRIETQVLHRYSDDWRAYNYVWNDEQTDAILQDDVATERKLIITDATAPGGKRTQTWRHSGRSECLLCHATATGSVQAFWPEQLNIRVGSSNQLDQLTRLGLFKKPVKAKSTVASPHDPTASLESRARAYLGMNCSTCHQNLGGGTANFNFALNLSLEENGYIDEQPTQGSFGMKNARVVAAGDPLRSVLIYRTLKSGRGHMPQIGSNVTDVAGIRLLTDWIASIPTTRKTGSSLQGQVKSLTRTKTPQKRIDSLLSSTSGAMALSLYCSYESTSASLKAMIVKAGTAHQDSSVRELFEHYLPEEQRVKRLGPTPDIQALLAMKGSAQEGKYLFEQAKDVNCRGCHRIGLIGQNVGPNLSGVGAQRKPEEILTSILKPSDKIDPKFRARQIVTLKGKVHVGIVLDETETQVSLVDTTGKTTVIAVDDIDIMEPAQKSAMPEQLFAGMTAQQAADLLAFLGTQRKVTAETKLTAGN